MSEERMGGAFICLSSCYKCGRQIEIEYYMDHFERKENATFLGRLGTMFGIRHHTDLMIEPKEKKSRKRNSKSRIQKNRKP